MSDQTKPALPTLAEIEAMEALLGRATPGPWRDFGGEIHCEPPSEDFVSCIGTFEEACNSENDRGVIVALRNAAPSLLAAARELLAREARTILWVEAATDGLTNLYVRDGKRLRFGGAFTREEYAIAAVTRTTRAALAMIRTALSLVEAERDALREELARVRERLEKATYFEWRGADGSEWNIHTFKDSPSADDKTWNVCKGIKLHKHAVTFDAAWAAAEQAAGETEKGGTP